MILIAPAGFPVEMPIYARYHFPLVTDIIAHFAFASIVPQRVIKGFEGSKLLFQQFNELGSYEDNKVIIDMLIEQRRFQVQRNEGYMPAIIACLREFPFSEMQSYFAAVNRTDVPVHAIWV